MKKVMLAAVALMALTLTACSTHAEGETLISGPPVVVSPEGSASQSTGDTATPVFAATPTVTSEPTAALQEYPPAADLIVHEWATENFPLPLDDCSRDGRLNT